MNEVKINKDLPGRRAFLCISVLTLFLVAVLFTDY